MVTRRTLLALAGAGLVLGLPAGRSQAAPARLGSLAPRRLALVIGNARYEGTPTLTNVPADAKLMADTLAALDFAVRPVCDANGADLATAFRDWLAEGRESDVRAVYYAGHGMELAGRTWLLPAREPLPTLTDLPQRAFNLSEVVASAAAHVRGVTLVFYDACRTSPLHSGKAAVPPQKRDRPPSGVLVAYAAMPGQFVSDGRDGQSPFARALARHLRQPDQAIEDALKQVASEVQNETGRQQQPVYLSSLTGRFCVRPGKC